MNKKILFQVHTYKDDFADLLVCLKSLRAYMFTKYPVQVVCDGDYMDAGMRNAVEKFGNVSIESGDRICPYKIGKAGWIVRKYKLLLDSKADVFISIDTDTRVWREPWYIPDADVFGHIIKTEDTPLRRMPFVQGGCMGMSRKFVEKVAPFYDNDGWQNLERMAVNRAGILADDVHSCVIAQKKLGMSLTHWDEVFCIIGSAPQNPLVYGFPRYAITHSHKGD